MSLLMDALKRAEKARQERDEKEQQQQRSERSQELTLQSIGEDDPAATDAQRVSATPPADTSSQRGLSLEDTDTTGLVDSGELRAVEDDIRSGKASLDASLEDTDSWDLSELETRAPLDLDDPSHGLRESAERSIGSGTLPLDETSSTLPSMRAAQRSVDDYFDGTHSASLSMEEVREAVTERSSGTTTDEQSYTDTSRRTARALLDGDLPGRRQRTGVIAAAVLIPLLLLVLGGAAYLFKDDILRLIDGPSPPLARRTPLPPKPAPPQPSAPATTASATGAAPSTDASTSSVTAPSTGAAVGSVATTTPTTDATAATSTPEAQATATMAASTGALASPSAEEREAFVAAAQALANTDASRATDSTGALAGTIDTGARAQPSTSAQAMTTMSSAAPSQASDSDASPEVALSDVMPMMATAPASSPPPSVDLDSALSRTRTPGLKITRRRGSSRVQQWLNEGYQAYQAGDDDTAARAYQKVLRARSGNRDAMLGMAAIYMRGGAVAEAGAIYTALLRRNPRDAAALSGLMALDQGADPVAGESQLKTLIASRPQDAHLYFTLGNVYAGQLRWPEAQQAYFDAVRFNATNPDYTFNLAVALDQLQQGRAAAQYYRRALELGASNGSAGFDAEGVRVRLAELERAG